MPNLTLEIAQQIIAASLAGERSSGDRHIAVAVCDAGAHPLALARALSLGAIGVATTNRRQR